MHLEISSKGIVIQMQGDSTRVFTVALSIKPKKWNHHCTAIGN
jgi:hypothetical protein